MVLTRGQKCRGLRELLGLRSNNWVNIVSVSGCAGTVFKAQCLVSGNSSTPKNNRVRCRLLAMCDVHYPARHVASNTTGPNIAIFSYSVNVKIRIRPWHLGMSRLRF